jgi:hypothetical protein
MGLETYTGRGLNGKTGCEATEWESETSVRCLMTHEDRGTRRVVMTAGERGGSVTQTYSSDCSCLSYIRPSNRAGTGSVSVTVHGSNFGLIVDTFKVRLGQSSCEATEWESEASVMRLFGQGASGTHRSVMTVGQRIGSVTQAWSVDMTGTLVDLLTDNSPMTDAQPLFVLSTGDFFLFAA